MTIEDYYKKQLQDGYISKNGAPLKCIKCESINLIDKVTDTLDGHTVLEYYVYCKDCGTKTGSWAYGNWQI